MFCRVGAHGTTRKTAVRKIANETVMKDDSVRDKAMDNLVTTQLRAGFKPGSASCPNPEILAAYVERTLAPRERANCESHLAGCLGCQALVAELVRLSEDDEPAEVQTAAGSSARAAAAPRLRWAWAGSALAAILVGGLWYTGEFRNVLQQSPETTRQIQNSEVNKAAGPPSATTEYDSKVTSPSTSESRRDQENKSNGHLILDQLRPPASTAAKNVGPRGSPSGVGGLGGTSAQRVTSAQTQDAMTTSTPQPAPPPSAADRFEPGKKGAIATPSERAALAKDGRGQGAGTIGRAAHDVSGGISGATPNNPSANQAKNDLAMTGRNTQEISPQTAPKAATERADAKKSEMQDEAKAKEQVQTNIAARAEVRENDRDKQRAAQSGAQRVSVGAVTEEMVEVQAEPATPHWRVGRSGLIQKRDANGEWRKMKSGVKAHLNDIAFSGPHYGWAVGQSGTILHTTDGGATWTKLPSPTPEDLVHVTAISNQEASVVTRGGQTFKTTDGGKTWSSKQ